MIGLASGVLDVAMNTEVVAVEDRFERRVMSSLHGSWSAAVLVGAAIATASIAAGVPMAVQLSVLALVLVVASFPLLRWLPAAAETSRETVARLDRRRSFVAGARLPSVCDRAGVLPDRGDRRRMERPLPPRGRGGGAAGRRLRRGRVLRRHDGVAVHRRSVVGRYGSSTVVRVGAATGAIALGTAIATGGAVVALMSLAVLGLALGPVVPAVFGVAGRLRVAPGRTALAIVLTAGYVGIGGWPAGGRRYERPRRAARRVPDPDRDVHSRRVRRRRQPRPLNPIGRLTTTVPSVRLPPGGETT